MFCVRHVFYPDNFFINFDGFLNTKTNVSDQPPSCFVPRRAGRLTTASGPPCVEVTRLLVPISAVYKCAPEIVVFRGCGVIHRIQLRSRNPAYLFPPQQFYRQPLNQWYSSYIPSPTIFGGSTCRPCAQCETMAVSRYAWPRGKEINYLTIVVIVHA